MENKKSGSESPSKLIDARIKELKDWRGEALSKVRNLIKQTGAEIVEEWKWGIPVWSCDGIICTGETYKDKVKLTFMRGAELKDASKLFNSSLEGNARRALDIFQDSKLNNKALIELFREAIAVNQNGTVKKAEKKSVKRPLKTAAKQKPVKKKTSATKKTKRTKKRG